MADTDNNGLLVTNKETHMTLHNIDGTHKVYIENGYLVIEGKGAALGRLIVFYKRDIQKLKRLIRNA
jgi:hypothetical protein